MVLVLWLQVAGWNSVGQELGAISKEEGRGNSNLRMGFFNNCPDMKKLQISKVVLSLLTPESQREPLPVDTMEILISI